MIGEYCMLFIARGFNSNINSSFVIPSVRIRGSIYFTQNKEGGDGVYQTLTVFSTQNTNGENLLKMVIFSHART